MKVAPRRVSRKRARRNPLGPDGLLAALAFGAVPAALAIFLWWDPYLVNRTRGGLMALAYSFWAPLAWVGIGSNYWVPSHALMSAAVWFAIASLTRTILKRDAYALLALGAFYAVCLIWGFFVVANQ